MRSRAVSFPALCSRSRRSAPPPASASALRRRSSAIGSLDFGSLVIDQMVRARNRGARSSRLSHKRGSTMPLNFGGIAGAHVAGILVDRQRRKFGISHAQNANGQMRGQIDAAREEGQSPRRSPRRRQECAAGFHAMVTARMVPCTRAIMEVSVNAAAPSTAVTDARILMPTQTPVANHSGTRHDVYRNRKFAHDPMRIALGASSRIAVCERQSGFIGDPEKD